MNRQPAVRRVPKKIRQITWHDAEVWAYCGDKRAVKNKGMFRQRIPVENRPPDFFQPQDLLNGNIIKFETCEGCMDPLVQP